MAESPVVSDHFTARKILDNVSRELDSVAHLLYQVGLTKVAERIESCIPDLDQAQTFFHNAFDTQLSESLRQSQEHVGGLLSLVLADCIKDPKDRRPLGVKDEA